MSTGAPTRDIHAISRSEIPLKPVRCSAGPTRNCSNGGGSILAHWNWHQDTLEAIIAYVLVHEIGHYFGFSDDDMHRIEDRAD